MIPKSIHFPPFPLLWFQVKHPFFDLLPQPNWSLSLFTFNAFSILKSKQYFNIKSKADQITRLHKSFQLLPIIQAQLKTWHLPVSSNFSLLPHSAFSFVPQNRGPYTCVFCVTDTTFKASIISSEAFPGQSHLTWYSQSDPLSHLLSFRNESKFWKNKHCVSPLVNKYLLHEWINYFY